MGCQIFSLMHVFQGQRKVLMGMGVQIAKIGGLFEFVVSMFDNAEFAGGIKVHECQLVDLSSRPKQSLKLES